MFTILHEKDPKHEHLLASSPLDNIPASLDPHQDVFKTNRCTEDAIYTALVSVSTHPENKISFIRMLFIVISSACSIISPMQLIWKTSHLGLEMDISAQSTERGHKLQNICTAYRQLCQFSPKIKEQFVTDCPHIVFCYRHMYMRVLKMWLYFVVQYCYDQSPGETLVQQVCESPLFLSPQTPPAASVLT